jgi:hypothetical protein
VALKMEEAGRTNDVELLGVLLPELKKTFERLRKTMGEITCASS